MIRETIREITPEEREAVLTPVRYHYLAPRSPGYREEGWMLAVAVVLLAGYVAFRGVPTGSAAAGTVSAMMVPLVLFIAAVVRDARHRARNRPVAPAAPAPRPTVLDDGRVIVKRVHATAVVHVEPVDDEGSGYLFDIGGGQVLFLKGLDYLPDDDQTPWPSTDFEIIRGYVDGEFVGMEYYGKELVPVNSIGYGEFDPEAVCDEREEVLQMSLDEAVRSILRRS